VCLARAAQFWIFKNSNDTSENVLSRFFFNVTCETPARARWCAASTARLDRRSDLNSL
jgi:hypothetical protein